MYFPPVAPELVAFFIGAAPAGGVRFALPWALTLGHLPIVPAFLFSLAGELVSIIAIAYLLPPTVILARRYVPLLDRIIEQILARTRTKHSARFHRFGLMFLVLAGLSPIPGIGPHTGVLIGYLFDVRRVLTIACTSLGATIIAILVAAATEGGITLFQFFVH